MLRSLSRVLLLLLVLGAALPAQAEGKLQIYFFDIGQGDGSLIITPSGKTILVDAGPQDGAQHLALRLRQLVKGKLDLTVLSHPHADHLGGMVEALSAVGTKRFLDPGFDHPSKSYRELLEWVGDNVGQVMNPIPDPNHPNDLITIGVDTGITMTILWPRKPVEPFLDGTRSDPNSNSIVFKLTYGKTAFLFVGDAEPDTEDVLIQKNIDFTSTVLKVGHHGGRHSSTEPFLAKVKPKIAVIQVGLHNDYGHPSDAAMDRLKAVGAEIFRNDQDGEIKVVSDGTNVTVTTERKHDGTPFVVKGESRMQVATGPILPSERHLSEATLEDQKRFGSSKNKPDDSVVLPGLQHVAAGRDLGGNTRGAAYSTKEDKAPVTEQVVVKKAPEKSPDELIPDEVKERYAVPVKGTDRQVKYVAARGSSVFHMANCTAAEEIKGKNRLQFWSRSEAAKARKPAEDCNP